MVFPAILGEAFWNHTPTLHYFSGFLGYVVLAVYLRRFSPGPVPYKRVLGLALLLAGYAVTAGGFLARASREYVWHLAITWGLETLNVAAMTLGIFLLIQGLPVPAFTTTIGRLLADI